MNWLAILLSAAALGGTAAPGEVKHPTKQQCKPAKQHAAKPHASKQRCKPKKAKPKTPPKAKAKPRQKPATTKPNSDAAPPSSTSPTQRGEDPGAEPTPTPAPKPGATPTPTPAPGPTYPSRTGVDLTDIREWAVRPSYRILAAGKIDFNVNNLGEDDHNLSVRGGGHEYGRLDLAPGDSDTLTVTLAAGPYTLYCSLEGHEEAGMRADISVR